MNLTSFDKAIAGGLVSMVLTWLAQYGITLSPVVHDAVASLAFAGVTYLAGHLTVYFAKNKV